MPYDREKTLKAENPVAELAIAPFVS